MPATRTMRCVSSPARREAWASPSKVNTLICTAKQNKHLGLVHRGGFFFVALLPQEHEKQRWPRKQPQTPPSRPPQLTLRPLALRPALAKRKASRNKARRSRAARSPPGRRRRIKLTRRRPP